MQRIQQDYFDLYPILWTVVKGFLLVSVFIYIIFAFMVIRQVKLMTDTLEVGYETPLKIFSYVHFIFAVGIFVYAFMTL